MVCDTLDSTTEFMDAAGMYILSLRGKCEFLRTLNVTSRKVPAPSGTLMNVARPFVCITMVSGDEPVEMGIDECACRGGLNNQNAIAKIIIAIPMATQSKGFKLGFNLKD
jgi:hypothetical protein